MSSAVPITSTPLRAEDFDLTASRTLFLLSSAGSDSSESLTRPSTVDTPSPPAAVPVPFATPSTCESELIFLTTHGSKKVLLCMCIGLTALPEEVDGVVIVGDTAPRPLGDVSVAPYIASSNKKFFKPVTKDLVSETLRRYEVLDIPNNERMRPKNKVLSVLYKWLQNHPITNPADVQFLRSEEKKFHDSVVLAIEEAKKIASVAAPGVIFTSVADLRLIHCLMDSDVKKSFLNRHDCMTRPELDGRNSPEWPKTWNETIAAKFNDHTFLPSSETLPELHGDYEESIDLRRSNCPCDLTSEQVKSWVASHKTKLLLFIARWELSGNGDGQRVEGDATFGIIDTEDHLIFGGDNRSDFLKGDRSSLLYFWYMSDKYEILPQVLSLLPTELGFSTLVERVSAVQESRGSNNNRTAPGGKKQRREEGSNGGMEGPLTTLIESMKRFADATMVVNDDDSGAAAGKTAAELETAKATAASKTAVELEMAKSLATKGVLDARKVGLELVLTSEAALATMMEKYESTPNASVSLKAFYKDRLNASQKRLSAAEASYNLLM